MPEPEALEDRVHRLFEGVWNGEDPSVADELVHPEYVIHDRDLPGDLEGPERYRALAAGTRRVFPDASFEIEDTVAAADTVAVRWQMTGTHRGPLMGVEATGETVTLPGVEFDRFESARLVETWSQSDMLGVLDQLGAAPGE